MGANVPLRGRVSIVASGEHPVPPDGEPAILSKSIQLSVGEVEVRFRSRRVFFLEGFHPSILLSREIHDRWTEPSGELVPERFSTQSHDENGPNRRGDHEEPPSL